VAFAPTSNKKNRVSDCPIPRQHSRSVDPVDITAGRNLRLARIRANVSQSALARSVGLTFQQIQKYECGINRISLSRAVQMTAVLGISVSDLLADTSHVISEPVFASPQFERWVRLFFEAGNSDVIDTLADIGERIVRLDALRTSGSQ